MKRLPLPSDFAASLALGTQQILQQETGLTDVVDPWGGSYMMETLTSEMIDYVNSTIVSLESGPGVLAKVEQGDIAFLIHQQAMEKLEVTPRFVTSSKDMDSALNIPSRVIDSAKTLTTQRVSLRKLKDYRNDHLVMEKLALLKGAALAQRNLMPFVIAAIRSRATVGEVVKTLCQVYPRFEAPQKFIQYSVSDKSLETSKLKCKEASKFIGRPIRVLLTKVGLDGHDRGIKQIAAVLRGVGMDVDYAPAMTSLGDIVTQLQLTRYDILGVSTLAGAHIDIARSLTPHINKVPTSLIMGGVIPIKDMDVLFQFGVEAVFTRRDPLTEIIDRIVSIAKAQHH